MSLILPQRIKIKWGSNKSYYIKLGYDFTKNGDEFEVDVEDLSDSSSYNVKVICDFCNNIYEIPYKQFNNLSSDKYCCPRCLTHKMKKRDCNGNLVFVEIPYRNKEWLKEEYINKGREAEDIANEFGINIRTLREWISKFDLTYKQDKSSNITKEELIELFVKQKLTTLEIGNIYGLSDGTILRLLKSFNIKIPNRSELMRRYYYEKDGLKKARIQQSTIENRIKSSCRQRGLSVKDFKGFSTDEQHMARNNTYYKEWKRKIFERDDYTCQCCGKRGGNLNAHHLYNFSDHEDLRYEVDNGITFCAKCHLINYPNSFHSIYGEKNNTPEQAYEFIENFKKGVI